MPNLPKITVLNWSDCLPDQEVRTVIRAINRQVNEDFLPLWGCGRRLVLRSVPIENGMPVLDHDDPSSVIILFDPEDWCQLRGLQTRESRVPIGWVAVDPRSWSVALSRETLEMILDPRACLFVSGPAPHRDRTDEPFVWHPYRVCKPVDRMGYRIDEIRVADFVTPAYYRECDHGADENDFLGLGIRPYGMAAFSALDLLRSRVPIWDRVACWSGPFDQLHVRRLRSGLAGSIGEISGQENREHQPWSRGFRYRGATSSPGCLSSVGSRDHLAIADDKGPGIERKTEWNGRRPSSEFAYCRAKSPKNLLPENPQ